MLRFASWGVWVLLLAACPSEDDMSSAKGQAGQGMAGSSVAAGEGAGTGGTAAGTSSAQTTGGTGAAAMQVDAAVGTVDAGTAMRLDAGPAVDAAIDHGGCVDDDGDGYGEGCISGRDCDDADAMATYQCYGCAEGPRPACPCDPGTQPLACDPPDARIMLDDGSWAKVVCSEGTMYCRDNVWSECEILWAYATIIAEP